MPGLSEISEKSPSESGFGKRQIAQQGSHKGTAPRSDVVFRQRRDRSISPYRFFHQAVPAPYIGPCDRDRHYWPPSFLERDGRGSRMQAHHIDVKRRSYGGRFQPEFRRETNAMTAGAPLPNRLRSDHSPLLTAGPPKASSRHWYRIGHTEGWRRVFVEAVASRGYPPWIKAKILQLFCVSVISCIALCGACATTPAVRQQCLPMKTYTLAQEQALAGALRALPGDSPLVRAMADYGQLRAANRACAHP